MITISIHGLYCVPYRKIPYLSFGRDIIISSRYFLYFENNNEVFVKRYALFHNNAVYVLHESFTKSEYDLISDNACICFISENIEYWSVKNVDLFAEI